VATREYVHASTELCSKNFNSVSKEYSKLCHWELLQAKPVTGKKGDPSNGYYKITQKGKDFVEGKVTVRKNVLTYNKEFLGYSGEEIHIQDAFNEYFDYDKMMCRS